MSDISDRHMRAVKGLLDGNNAQKVSVRIRLSPSLVGTMQGQLTLTCLVNLLCRLTDLVDSIELVGGLDAPLRVPIPSGASGTLLNAAAGIASWAVGQRVAVRIGDGQGEVNIALLVGRGMPDDRARHTLAGYGAGWRAWLGEPDNVPETRDADDPNPLGPFLMASLLTGEVFKRARGISRGRYLEPFGYSLWSGRAADSWEILEDGPPLQGAVLPAFYLVGAGAVGQGLGYVLGSSKLSGFVVTIDDDTHDTTNLNRCFLAGAEDDGHPKVDSVERFLRPNGIKAIGRRMIIRDYVSDMPAGLPPELAANEARARYEIVVSCVDKGVSRQDLQGLWPRWLFGGSTEGLTAKAMFYDVSGGTACLGCHNPPESDGDHLRLLEQQVRAMTLGERAAFLEGKVKDVQAVLDYLDVRKCGEVGEAQFRALALEHGHSFSVSFVSLGASLLLASALLRHVLFREQAPARDMMASLNFLNGGAIDTVLAVNHACPRCGGGGRAKFDATWA